jgi:hypothetical protein
LLSSLTVAVVVITGELLADDGSASGEPSDGDDCEPQPAAMAIREPAESTAPESKNLLNLITTSPCSLERSIAPRWFGNIGVRSHRRLSVCTSAATAIAQAVSYRDSLQKGKVPALRLDGDHRDSMRDCSAAPFRVAVRINSD